MRARLVRVGCLLLLASSLAFAANDKAFWGIFVETVVNKSVGMPDMSAMLQNLPPEALANLPPEVRAMMGGGAARRVSMRFWTPGTAPEGATATVFAPDGFGQGERLPMQLIRPGEIVGDRDDPEPGEEVTELPQGKMRIEIYWGSSATVKPGQPKVIEVDLSTMTPEQRTEWREQMENATSGGYRADWTQAIWPRPQDQPNFAESDLTGNFRLESTYGGGVDIDVPATVGYLDPIQFSSPKFSETIDLTKAVEFAWPAIANVLGYHGQITGFHGTTFVIWHAGEAEPNFTEAVDFDFMQMADVRRLVAERLFMPGEADEVTVPEGIFAECDMVGMVMTGYGTGTARDDTDPLPRVQTKTVFTGSLGGKMMAGMMPGGGGRPRR